MVIRYPPYDYEHNWIRAEGDARLDDPNDQISGVHTGVPVSRELGHAEFSWFERRGYIHGTREVGVYYRPPYPGWLTIRSTPIYSSYYYSSGIFERVTAGIGLGLSVSQYEFSYNYNISNPPTTAHVLSADSYGILGRVDYWLIGVEEIFEERKPVFLSTQCRVDDSRWYAIWVKCGHYLGGAASQASMSMDIPWIDVQFSRTLSPFPGHRTLPGYRTR